MSGRRAAGAAAGTVAVLLAWALVGQSPAYAADAPVGLGTAASYSVLGGQTVTNTGPTTLAGELGVSPKNAITGFPPGHAAGATHAGDAQAATAQSDLTTAYNDAAGRAATKSVAGDLVGQTLTAGVYKSTGPLAVSGALTLDGKGNPDSVFIFQVAKDLITASASRIVLTNSAQACNIYWQVGSSATLGTGSTFKGNILALTSVTVTTGTTVAGRALARNGQVSLDTNVFTLPGCTTASASSSASATATGTAIATSPASGGAGGGETGAPEAGGTPSGGTGTNGTGGTGTGTNGTGGTGTNGTGGASAGINHGLNIQTAAEAGPWSSGPIIAMTVGAAGLTALTGLWMLSGTRRRALNRDK